ncbi:hypothetical protein [Amycolatopsis sp. cmx-11-51]|uniref:hypothetical protein n=1 Tax=unclassified Amycolatopsis TaxID=2618356 RepID=UPI0039E5AFDC
MDEIGENYTAEDTLRRGVGTTLVEAGVAAEKVLHGMHHPASKLVVDVNRPEQIAGLAEQRGLPVGAERVVRGPLECGAVP